MAEEGYGLDVLVHDENPHVRAAVAKQGYGLDKLFEDRAINVRKTVNWYLRKNRYKDINDWIMKNPDKCVQKSNQKGEIKMEMKLINKTLHCINFIDDNGEVERTIEPDGIPARVMSTSVVVAEINGIKIEETQFGEIEGLPEEEGVYYIVSRIVATAASRKDLLVPGQQVRDEDGRVVGCRSLSR